MKIVINDEFNTLDFCKKNLQEVESLIHSLEFSIEELSKSMNEYYALEQYELYDNCLPLLNTYRDKRDAFVRRKLALYELVTECVFKQL